MTYEPCRAQVVIQGRRGLLTDSGKLALDAHLGGCASCRMDQQILADLDDASMVDIRDGARLDRLSAAARDWAHRRHGTRLGRKARRRGTRIGYVAASILLLASAAGAATWWRVRRASEPERGEPPVAATRRSSAPRAVVAPTMPPAATAGDAAPAERSRASEQARRARRPAKVASVLTSASLLRQAGEARRGGQGEQALTLYRRLQSDFADSPEAAFSRVPAGNLLLDRGHVRDALAEFERYLAASPDGVLVAEALYGRARCLTAQRKSAEALRAWQQLVREFPSSAYAPLARRRIAEAR